MLVDNTTLYDLAVFSQEEEQSLLHHLNFTRTNGGRAYLAYYLKHPLQTIQQIQDRQLLLKSISEQYDAWPQIITNGSVMMIEKYFESQVNEMPHPLNALNGFMYKITSGPDYSLIHYSINHFIDFVKGLNVLTQLFINTSTSTEFNTMLLRIVKLLHHPAVHEMVNYQKKQPLPVADTLRFGYFIRHQYKQETLELIDMYDRLDAFYSIVTAQKNFKYRFPQFIDSEQPQLQAVNLYHPLLPKPVAYNMELTEQHSFLFLTGANMAGKSTYIKAVGIAVYMAHLGMAVPAQTMQLTTFEGLISNIQVVDNVIKGESFFFNEVQRIRKTIHQINNNKKWLVLIDELFKGTNVRDAMRCSTEVIEGFRKMHHTLFILSTHLYEIGEDLRKYDNIQFRFFETQVKDEQLYFSYQLKDGISNDRLGYLILKREGIIDMLSQLH